MEDRRRTLIAVLIALVVVVALLYSFGLTLFADTPQLNLADPDQSEGKDPGVGTPNDAAGILVSIEPSTVQSVIASLSRFESYSRTVYVTYNWGDGESETVTSQVWEDSGWVRTDTVLNTGIVESSIVGDDTLWLWYEDGSGDTEVQTYIGSAQFAAADRMQSLPTYEDVLTLDPANITGAGYVEYEGQACIYVEAEHQTLGYLYRYWISETSGLLMAAETEKAGVVVYRMQSNEVISPVDADRTTFTLPNGITLHITG